MLREIIKESKTKSPQEFQDTLTESQQAMDSCRVIFGNIRSAWGGNQSSVNGAGAEKLLKETLALEKSLEAHLSKIKKAR